MNFTAEKRQIIEALQNAAAVAERRNTIPILANMLIKTSKNIIEFTATDLEIQIKSSAEVTSVKQEGEITVSARKMSELCKSLPDEDAVNFYVELGKLSVRAKNFQADLSTIAADNFPELECMNELSRFEVPSAELKRILNKTQFSMGATDVRTYLNGSLLEIKEGTLSAIATDGHRLAKSTTENLKTKESSSNIVPRRAVLELTKILQSADDSVNLVLGSNFISIISSSFTFSSKLLEGEYPNYHKVFPKGEASSLLVDKKNLQEALNRASILSNEKYRGVKFNLTQDLLKLTTNNPEQEIAEEDVKVKYEGKNLEIGFNIGYLEDVLNSMETLEVELFFYGEDSSCLLKPAGEDSSLYVVMPMRL